MKHTFTLFILLTLGLSINGCKSPETLMEKAQTTEYGPAFCQAWTGGAPGSGSGLNLSIPMPTLDEKTTINYVIFRKRKATGSDLEFFNREITARYLDESIDVEMNGNPNEEAQNGAPVIYVESDLKDEQAEVSYTFNGETTVVIIQNIKERPHIYYPSAPQQGGRIEN